LSLNSGFKPSEYVEMPPIKRKKKAKAKNFQEQGETSTDFKVLLMKRKTGAKVYNA